MSEFTESIDDLIASFFTDETLMQFQRSSACSINDYKKAYAILDRLIRTSIAHARKQIAGRKTGTMTFDEAMRIVRKEDEMVTRPGWGILRAVRRNFGFPGSVCNFKPDNTEGLGSGDGWPYKPTDEDRAATDWMYYQTPDENWVELDFFEE